MNSSETDHSRESRRTVKRRHPWRWVAAVALIVFIGWLLMVLSRARISWDAVGTYILHPAITEAVWATLWLSIVAEAVAIVLGLVVAIMGLSANPVARAFASGFVWIFRGVPVLLQILVWYNLALIVQVVSISIPGTGVVLWEAPTNQIMTPFFAAMLGLSLNEAAYMAEIVRSGIKSVDHGQIEAASALALTPGQTMNRVVLPQAIRVIIPPTGNDYINMLKSTSLASVITYPELLRASQNISAVSLDVMETLFAAAFWYMVVVSLFSVGQYFLEKKFERGVAGGSNRSDSLVAVLKRSLFGLRRRRTAPATQASAAEAVLETGSDIR